MKTPIDRKTLQQHMLYNSWKYILLVIVAIFGWNLIFTMTAYRSPAHLVVDLYTYGLNENEALTSWLKDVHEREMSDMEQMEVGALLADETYGVMLLMTRLAAGDGDVYIMPKAEWQSYAGQGALMALEQLDGLMALCEEKGLSLERGLYRVSDTGERHTFGIPVGELKGLSAMLGVGSDYVVCAIVNNGNDSNTVKLMEIMVRELSDAPAEDAP